MNSPLRTPAFRVVAVLIGAALALWIGWVLLADRDNWDGAKTGARNRNEARDLRKHDYAGARPAV